MFSYKLTGWCMLLLLLCSCYGEEGPPGPVGPRGPMGPPGEPGSPGVGLMYEAVFDLNASNKWEFLYEFPMDDNIFLEDVVLVYLLWDQVETEDEPLDVWRLMPVSYFYDEGMLQINYDFSVTDVRIFAEAAFPLDAELDRFEDFLARIVVVPANYSPNARRHINFEDYAEVEQVLKLPRTKRTEGTPFMHAARALSSHTE